MESDEKLTDVQLNVLRELYAGKMVVIDKMRMASISGRSVAFQTLKKLQDLKMVTLRDPKKKNFAKANGYVLAERGKIAFEKSQGVLERPATTSLKELAAKRGLHAPAQTTLEDAFTLLANHETATRDEAEFRTAKWFISSVISYRQLQMSEEELDRLAAALRNDPKAWKSVLGYRSGHHYPHAVRNEPLIVFANGDGNGASRRTTAFTAAITLLEEKKGVAMSRSRPFSGLKTPVTQVSKGSLLRSIIYFISRIFRNHGF